MISRRDILRAIPAFVLSAKIQKNWASPTVMRRNSSLFPRKSLDINMQYRMLGKTGIRLSEISVGGHNPKMEKKHSYYRGTMIVPEAADDLMTYSAYYRERTEQIACALDAGVNFFDPTNDREVRSLATALNRLGRRNDCYICGDFLRGRYHDEKGPEELRESLIEHINKTIRVFKTDRVDLMRVTTFEKWSMEDLAGGIDGFQYLKKEGKARFFGFSSHNPQYIKEVLSRFAEEIDFLVTPYSFALRQSESEIFPICYEKGIGVITIKPFHGGSFFRTGADAVRAAVPRKSTPSKEILESLPRDGNETLAQANLRYILSNPDITATIPGVNSCDEILENAMASGKTRAELFDQSELLRQSETALARLPRRYEWLKQWRLY